ncbi:hypothetical protein NHX12_022014 [Muraenolepis orangiensis]|uniref:Uncharacterized protein n=1 Tax=Muraenolepis orangiensis TaxID=630683 RepID=A0A9Q0EQS5_9TELE|nr:hypothetical protein NHX12_022014 [Muraenolepis orangiensis]
MEDSWRTHGGLMEDSWRTHGGLMEDSWRTHGGLMEDSWRTHGGLRVPSQTLSLNVRGTRLGGPSVLSHAERPDIKGCWSTSPLGSFDTWVS